MSKENIDFKEIVSSIEKKEILLPDFQRKFVWTDEEQQKKIVASVLAKMPIGSILLLESSEPNEYKSKAIGSKASIDSENINGNVQFLLDGQQRMTVLTNVFSNAIHESCTKVSELISPTLKRRFFLRIPKWNKCEDEEDIFGVKDLSFKYQNPDTEYPDFLSGNILPFIVTESFLAGDNTPYNPKNCLSTELDTFCLNYEDGYLVPLFLLIPLENKNKSRMKLRFETIIELIAENIKNEVKAEFCKIKSEGQERIELFINNIIDEDNRNEILNNNELLDNYIEEKARIWESDLKEYLNSCIRNIYLNKIVVEKSQRERAIDIYENLNRGGVSLSTFDLIMARVATVSNQNYYERIVENINKKKEYPLDVVPSGNFNYIKLLIENKDYVASIRTKCYDKSKNDIVKVYIDTFLNVLSLYCYNEEFNPDNYKIEYIKRDKILSIEPIKIDNYCERVCTAIDRSMFFFQTRCGIRNIKEINYSLMIVLVATIFIKDEWFYSIKMHKLLEAWYWETVFSGSFDKDQNKNMITNLQQIIKTFNNQITKDWLINMKEQILDSRFFSDKGFLLMENADVEKYPKSIIGKFMCQYLLAQTYTDMFDNTKIISVFMEDADDLEAHHIIPLGSVKTIGESTQKLRNKNDSIYNSPLNFVYITKESNKKISSMKLNDYIGIITSEAKSKLFITSYIQVSEEVDDTKMLLSARFDALQGNIKEHISKLLE